MTQSKDQGHLLFRLSTPNHVNEPLSALNDLNRIRYRSPWSGSSSSATAKKSWPNSYDVKVHADSSDEEGDDDKEDEDDDDDAVLVESMHGFRDTNEEVKLVLAVRTDLGMTKGVCACSLFTNLHFRTAAYIFCTAGKIAAQCSHATLACYKTATSHPPSSNMLQRWENGGQPKIAVQVKSEEELLTVQAQALSFGLCSRVIRDAGRTQIAAGSATVVGVLGPKSVVDQVTGQLKLL